MLGCPAGLTEHHIHHLLASAYHTVNTWHLAMTKNQPIWRVDRTHRPPFQLRCNPHALLYPVGLCRLMVQTQQLWLSELSSATGRSSYGTSSPALQVHLPEHLVSCCSLGQVVHIIGHASTAISTAGPASAQTCCIQVNRPAASSL